MRYSTMNTPTINTNWAVKDNPRYTPIGWIISLDYLKTIAKHTTIEKDRKIAEREIKERERNIKIYGYG